MALEAERLGIELRLDCALTHGEWVSEPDRLAIARVFGARVLEHYSSKEGGQVAYSCPSGHGLHVSAESVLLEIVDERRAALRSRSIRAGHPDAVRQHGAAVDPL